jgi:polysaccharide export outer membrane protein
MELPMTRNSFLCVSLPLCFWTFCALACLIAGPAARAQATAPLPQDISQSARPTISPGDILDVEVFDSPELSLSPARVSTSGQVNLPVLGPVEVAGQSASDAARHIESELRGRSIMLEPHVTVSVLEYAMHGATVLGEIKSPGVYPTAGDRRLLDMIALAGGLAPSAGKLVTIAHRDDPTHPAAITLVSRAQQLGAQQNPVILPGDTVVVGRAGIIYILGAVNKPGGFLIDNNEHISLMESLSLAGGWDKSAMLSGVHLIRKVPEGREDLTIDIKHVLAGKQADVTVENGDILFVPLSIGKTLAYKGVDAAIVAAQTAVVYSGNY